ncbi:MAG: hypothetical protein A3B68_01145 [Candidatus Melainabacteria bacterium RIFCSPHIGHO2_02_FULL_34_12]|nr:MAG: hypothetical protein A3B68_01145 [Candidatus Melainabacteria bacterium RIFCSPHIGHO2_02_FULL_34_12]
MYITNNRVSLEKPFINGYTTLQYNQWYHITATSDGNSTKLYLNGYLDSYGNAGPFDFTGSLIGNNSRSQKFTGQIAQVRIYNRAISPEEVFRNSRYRAEPISDYGIEGWWKFEETDGNTVKGYKSISSSEPSLAATLDGFSSLNYSGRGSEYIYNIKEYKLGVPKFPPNVPDQRQNILCSVNDTSRNGVIDEYEGKILIINSAISNSATSSGNQAPCCYCQGNNIKCQEGIVATCLGGTVLCKNGVPSCCRAKDNVNKCSEKDPSIRCTKKALVESITQPTEAITNENTVDDSASTTDNAPKEYASSGYIVPKKDAGLGRGSNFLKKVACTESAGKFVVKGADLFTGLPADYKYSNSKLSIYKINQEDGAFKLKLITELDTSIQLDEECTRTVQAAVAGPVIYDSTTRELIVADANGVNVAKIFKVNFDNADLDGSNIKVTEKGKLNISSVYDGYVTDSIITPSYGKSHYLAFAKPNEKNYSHNLLLFPVIEDPNISQNTADEQKGQVTETTNTPTGQAIVLSAGGGAFNTGQNPFDTPQSMSEDATKADNTAKEKADDAISKIKDKNEKKDDKSKKEEKSSSSSGSYSSSSGSYSSSSGGRKEECIESKECIKDVSLQGFISPFCIEIDSINGKEGKCISNPFEKISKYGKLRTGQCLDKEIRIEGRKKGRDAEVFCVRTNNSVESHGLKREIEEKSNQKINNPNEQLPEANKELNGLLKSHNPRGHPNNISYLKNNHVNDGGSLNKILRDPSGINTVKDNKIFLDGAFFAENFIFSKDELVNVQDIMTSECKNFVDCKYNEGFFCIGNIDSLDKKIGTCKHICLNGKVAGGLDEKGDSLPCPEGLFESDYTDLSGRKVCCSTKITKQDEEKFQNIGALGCANSSQCKKEEFCANISSQTNLTGCTPFNCKGASIKPFCPFGFITLAKGPEGSYCCPLIAIPDESNLSSSSSGGISSSSSGGEISSSSSGEISSSSSGGYTSSSSGGHTSSSSGGSSSGGSSSSSSSGGSSSSSSSSSSGGLPKDYSIILVLETPEIFATGLKARTKANLKALVLEANTNIMIVSMMQAESLTKKNENINVLGQSEYHSYYAGEPVTITASIQGPDGAKPQDISSYTISIIAMEKPQGTGDPSIAKLYPLELSVEDILSSTDVINFFRNPPPLNISLIREKTDGNYSAAAGDIFNLTLPDPRYLAKGTGKIRLYTPDNPNFIAPENNCSSKGGAICGTKDTDIANCISYQCWKYSKGSPYAKDCCKGLLPPILTSELAASSSGAPGEAPLPACDKNTNILTCKTTNILYVPYCKNRFKPECTPDRKPLCKPLSASSSGAVTDAEPKCVPFLESTETYCKDVSTLPYSSQFDAGRCVSDFCDYIKNPEEKKGCCAACGSIYDKLTSPDFNNTEEEAVKSCLDFNGGICEQYKKAETCVLESCYKKDSGSEDLKSCCLKYDKELSRVNELLKQAKTEENNGMVYNVITLSDSKGPVKIQKSAEDILSQKFILTLPSDPLLSSLAFSASIKDKKGKTKSAVVKIALVPGKVQKDDTTVAEEETDSDKSSEKAICSEPLINSTSIINGGTVKTFANSDLEIPVTASSDQNNIVSFSITGLNSDLKLQEINKDPGYNYSLIKGRPTSPGNITVNATARNKCNKESMFSFTISVAAESQQIAEKPSGNDNTTEKDAVKKDSESQPEGAKEILAKTWTPKVPVLSSSQASFELKTLRTSLSGSKISLELNSDADLMNINPALLKISLISSNNKSTIIPAVAKILPENMIKLILHINNDEPSGLAKIIIANANDEKIVYAKSEINIIKPQETKSIKGKTVNAPLIIKHAINQDPVDKHKVQISIQGKNFIGKRALINGKKTIIPKKNKENLSAFTIAEFRNSNIIISKIKVTNKNSELILEIKLPDKYPGGKEELFISTPSGQTFTEIDLPKI